MRFLSYDPGVKHLAYCLAEFDEETKRLKIDDWDVINVLKDDYEAQTICSHVGKTKHKIKCKKYANFRLANNETYYCKTHKKNYKYVAPKISKCNSDEKCSTENCNKKVKYIVDEEKKCPSCKKRIDEHFKKNYTLKKVKTIKIRDVPIDRIVDKMYEAFDTDYKHLLKTDVVLIELQSSLNAPKMKSVSNYIAAYYKIRGQVDVVDNKDKISLIKYYKATNKLEFNKENDDTNKGTYKNRKKTSIQNVTEYLEYKNDMLNLDRMNNHKKKDDLADTLLQILSYLKMNKYLD